MEILIHVLLFSGLCLFTQSIPSQYVLIQEQKTWYEAQVYCRQNFMDLATVESNEEWTHLQETAQLVTSSAWTGLYNDINSWRWSYKDEKMTFVSWSPNEPDNADGLEEFVFMDQSGWHDVHANAPFGFVCYDENRTGADRFILFSNKVIHRDAQSYCRQYHTDLAIIRSKEENDLLKNMIVGVVEVWIGLFRDSWKWSDGTNGSASSINWMSPTRDILWQKPPCGAAGSDGRIDDRLCSDPLPFICMHRPKNQIVRLEVKSGLNVNDPVVMENILQSIKQKLNDHGIEKHIRVSWRQQSDGNVFFFKP